MLWEINQQLGCLTDQFEYRPHEVLYDFDGPRIFTTINGSLMYLWYECDEDTDSDCLRYLVVPADRNLIRHLKQGSKTVHDALRQPWLWVIDVIRGEVTSGWISDLDSIPVHAKPHRDAPLWPELEPLLAYRLIGDGLREGEIPASVVARAISGPTSALKTLFETVNNAASNLGRPDEQFRKLYGVMAKRFAFNSFEVAFDIPSSQEALDGIAPTNTSRSAHEIETQANLPGFPSVIGFEQNKRMEIYNKGAGKLIESLNWLTSNTSNMPLPELNMLYVLKELVPPKHGQITATEVKGRLVGSQALTLTRDCTIKVKQAISESRELQRSLETKEGRIGEFDKDKLVCTIRNSSNIDTICSFSEEQYDDLYDAFHNDKNVVIQGRIGTDRRILEIIAVEMINTLPRT